MSEARLQPWMRASEETEPVPGSDEKHLVFRSLRGLVLNVHNEARELGEGDLVHTHRDGVCTEAVQLETDDEGSTVTLTVRNTVKGAAYAVDLMIQGTLHEYTGDERRQCVGRADSVVGLGDADSANSLALEVELAALLDNGGATTHQEAGDAPEVRPGITVGRTEMGVLAGLISQATFLPR